MKRRVSFILFWALAALLLALPTAGLCQGYQVVKPCYVDVPQWQRGELQGIMMTMGDGRTMTATVQYSQGDKEIDVVFNKGITAVVPASKAEAMAQMGVSVESSNGSMKVTQMEGYTVMMAEEKGESKGSHIMVILERPSKKRDGSILVFDTDSVPLQQLLEFAKRFDWGCFSKKAATVW